MFEEKMDKQESLEKEQFQSSYSDEKGNLSDSSGLGGWENDSESDTMDEADLALTLQKAWQYYDEDDYDTAGELFELAVSSDPGCREARVGQFCAYYWNMETDSSELLDEQGLMLYKKAKFVARNEYYDALRAIEQDIFEDGMAVLKEETQDGTYFESYDEFGPHSEYVEIIRMVADFMEADALDRFLLTYETNYSLYLQMLDLQNGDPKAMVLADPEYAALQKQCQTLESDLSTSRKGYLWVEWWNWVLSAACALISFVAMGDSDFIVQTLGISVHLIPALISVMLVISINTLRGEGGIDFTDALEEAAIPAALLYLVVEFVIFRMAKSLDPSLTWGTMLYGVYLVLGIAIALVVIVLLFDEFKTAVIFGIIAFVIYKVVGDFLGVRGIDWYVVEQIRPGIFVTSIVLSVAMTVILVKKYFENNKKVSTSTGLKRQLAEATEQRDKLYAQKLAQLRAPYEGHVADVYLAELDKVLK